MLRVTERFIKIILNDRYLIINLENLEVTEDTEIDMTMHEYTQRVDVITRGSKLSSRDTSYSIACVYDKYSKPSHRTIMNMWCFS